MTCTIEMGHFVGKHCNVFSCLRKYHVSWRNDNCSYFGGEHDKSISRKKKTFLTIYDPP